MIRLDPYLAQTDSQTHIDALLVEERRDAGDVLIAECDRQDTLYFLREGTVEVSVAGLVVGELEPGALIGEIGLFAHAERTASVVARTPLVLRRLSRDSYEILRDARHPLAQAIEAHAMAQLMNRMRRLIADLKLQARRTSTEDLEPGEPASAIEVPVPAATLVAALEEAPAFANTVGALDAVAEGATMVTLPADAMVAEQGWKPRPLYLLTGGEVEWRLQLDDRQVPIASVHPGELLALPTHVDGKARPVDYVCMEPSSFVALAPDTVAGVLHSSTAAGMRLRTAVIRSLADRVLQLNARYTLLKLTAVEVEAAPSSRAEFDPEELIQTLPPPEEDAWAEEGTDTWDTWFDIVASQGKTTAD